MQFRYGSQYVASVGEGKVFRYPAWRALSSQNRSHPPDPWCNTARKISKNR